jgi:hypothetical protein
MANSDDDLIVPLKRVLRKKTKPIFSSDSDEPIIIDDDEEPPKPIKKKVVHRRKIIFINKEILFLLYFLAEISEDNLDKETKQAIREQKERDARIQLRQEREEAARLERSEKQIEYNGAIITDHEKKKIPFAFELVLETDPNSGGIIIEVDLMLVQYMKQHQGRAKKNLNSEELFFLFSRRCSISLESSI